MTLRLWAALGLLALAGCIPAGPETSQPYGVHSAPQPNTYLAPSDMTHQAAPTTTSLTPTRTVKVGLLLPLTGHNADLGRAMQDAATIALFDRYAHISPGLQAIKVELVPHDTGDTPEQAAQAMKAAVSEGAVFVIGPVFSDATSAVAPIAQAAHIGVLSFSNNMALARPGIYPFGFSPQAQTQRVVAYAAKQGKTRIAVLVPDSTLGATVLATTKETLAAHGLTLMGEGHYASAGVGIDKAVAQLVGTGAPNFDTLLLPEGGAALPTILRSLAQRGVTPPNVQLIGTGIWDDDTLVRRVSLDGAWLASSSPEGTTAFESRFMDTYKYNPPRVASLAYDAVSLAVTLATSDRGFTQQTLTSSSGFAGPANGIFRLHADGKVERGLAVLQIEGTDFNVLDPSPTSF